MIARGLRGHAPDKPTEDPRDVENRALKAQLAQVEQARDSYMSQADALRRRVEALGRLLSAAQGEADALRARLGVDASANEVLRLREACRRYDALLAAAGHDPMADCAVCRQPTGGPDLPCRRPECAAEAQQLGYPVGAR